MIKLALVGFAVTLLSSASAWEPDRPLRQLPDTELDGKIRILEAEAIQEAGTRKSTATVAALEFVLGVQDWTGEDEIKIHPAHKKQVIARRVDARHSAKIALAKIGVKKYLLEYIEDLKSPNDMKAVGAINSLNSIRDRRTVKYLIPFLDKDFVPKFTPGKRGPAEFSTLAEEALASILPDVREQFRKENPGRRFFFKKEWQAWWAANKDRFQEGVE